MSSSSPISKVNPYVNCELWENCCHFTTKTNTYSRPSPVPPTEESTQKHAGLPYSVFLVIQFIP